jgi:hypothetical protein
MSRGALNDLIHHTCFIKTNPIDGNKAAKNPNTTLGRGIQTTSQLWRHLEFYKIRIIGPITRMKRVVI